MDGRFSMRVVLPVIIERAHNRTSIHPLISREFYFFPYWSGNICALVQKEHLNQSNDSRSSRTTTRYPVFIGGILMSFLLSRFPCVHVITPFAQIL